ncbi:MULTISPECIES: hypothetical protein [Streptomyces]|uniref:BlaI/MecI/CopY family transcriptional regulator n=2 Tax=Streptomyces TaxID=1883 RepID=A0AB39NZR1_9ACTN|nr:MULTISPECIES: hypothetical protein [Streptomyces]GGS60690.1 hypothetical protein GCM10010285_44980 [Streptomyces rubiginosus]
MVPATRAAQSIQTTAASLQADLARLELQKRALERELAAVAAHLDSVQRALTALSAVLTDPAAETGHLVEEDVARTRAVSPAPEPATDDATPSGTAASDRVRNSRRPKASAQKYGKLTEQILEYFAGLPDTAVRARDVAAALGRDTDSGSINAVRSTLDRLVGASRIDRAGRGLYRAKQADGRRASAG